jgi:hypothetical protein
VEAEPSVEQVLEGEPDVEQLIGDQPSVEELVEEAEGAEPTGEPVPETSAESKLEEDAS